MLFLTTCTVLYVFLYSGQKCNAPAFLLQAASRNWMTVTRTIIIIIIIFIFSNNNDDALALQDGNGSYTADRWRHRASCFYDICYVLLHIGRGNNHGVLRCPRSAAAAVAVFIPLGVPHMRTGHSLFTRRTLRRHPPGSTTPTSCASPPTTAVAMATVFITATGAPITALHSRYVTLLLDELLNRIRRRWPRLGGDRNMDGRRCEREKSAAENGSSIGGDACARSPVDYRQNADDATGSPGHLSSCAQSPTPHLVFWHWASFATFRRKNVHWTSIPEGAVRKVGAAVASSSAHSWSDILVLPTVNCRDILSANHHFIAFSLFLLFFYYLWFYFA